MAEKRSWRDYSKSYSEEETATKLTGNAKTGTWRDYTSDKFTESGKASGGWRDYSTFDPMRAAYNYVANRVSGLQAALNKSANDYTERYSGRKYTYEDAYVSDSASWLDTATKQKNKLDAEANAIISYMDRNSDYIDADWANSIRKTLDKWKGQQEKLLVTASQDNEWWRQFEDADMVKEHGSAEGVYNYYKRAKGYKEKYGGLSVGGIDEILKTLPDGEEKEWLEAYKWGQFLSAPDFEEYAKKGADIENPTMEDAESDGQFLWWEWGGEEIGNIVTYSRENANALATARANNSNTKGNYMYRSLKDKEVDLHNYLLAKYGKETSDAFLADMMDVINAREGGALADRLKGIDIPVVEELAIGAFGLGAGVDQWASGVKQFFSDDVLPTTDTQYANAKIADSLDGFGKYAYQATNVVGNMAPSILATYVTGGLGASTAVANAAGAAAVGISAGGNAYGDALKSGYSAGQARNYGVLVGAAEGSLQYLLGGIGKLGGVTDDIIKAKLNMIDQSLLRVSAKVGVDILSEVTEEEIQLWLEPVLRSIVFGEAYDAPTIDEMIETAIVTAISTPVLGGAGTVKQDLAENKYYTATGEGITGADGGVDSLMNLSDEVYDVSDSKFQKEIAKARDRVTSKQNARRVGMLYDTVSEAHTEYAGKANKTDIMKSLTRGESGLTASEASLIAEALVAQANGQELTKKQTNVLESYKYNAKVQNALNNIVKNKNSTVGQRNKVMSNFADELRKPLEGAVAAKKVLEDTAVGEIAEASESVYEASEDGKTRLKSSGQTVTIQKIASVKNGKMTLQLEDGSKVDASEVEYGSADDAIVYETVASLATNAAAANLMLSTYKGSGVPAQVFAKGMEEAYRYGSVGMPAEQMLDRGSFLDDLTDYQLNTGYELGKMFGGRKIAKEQGKTVAKTDTGSKVKAVRKKGRVKGYGVKMKDLGKAFNTAQEQAYKILCQIAEVTGIDIVLFQSKPDANGNLRGGIIDGIDMNDSQGAFSWKNNKIYIDINAGVLKASDLGDVAKYSMLRTFSHEFIHFLEKHDAQQYNVFKDIVFDVMRRNGVDPDALIEDYMKRHKGTTRGAASCEVVAEAMTDILPESNFIQELAQKHKNIFEKLLDRLKEFVAEIKAHFKSMGGNQSKEAAAVKDYMGDAIQYAEGLVEAFDRLAVSAVENYQKAATAQKYTATEGGVQMQTRSVDGNQVVWIEANILKENTGQPVHQFIADYIAEHIGEVYTIIESGQKVYIGEDLPGEYTQSKYTQALLKKKSSVLKAKNRATSNLGEMIEIATNRRWEKTQHTHSKDAKYGMYRYDTRFGFPVKNHKGETVGANVYRAELLIRNASDGKKYLYDLVSIKKDTASSGWLTQRVASAAEKTAGQKGNVSTNSIRNNSGNVNNNSSEEQHQERTNTLTNWDVLEQAAQMLEGQKKFRTKNLNGKTDLNELEKERAELQERLAKQKELGKEAADTAKIRKQIKDIDIAIEAARATLQLTDGQRYALNEFNRRLKNVRELSAQKADQQRILEEQKSGGAEAIEVNRTKNRIDTLNRMIRKGTEELLDIENKAVLKQVLNKARTVIEKEQAALRREAVEKYRDRRNENQKKTEMRRKIRKTIRDLSKLLNHGTKERNVKEGMKELATKTIESAEVLFKDTVTNEELIRNGIGTDLAETEAELVQQSAELIRQIDALEGYDNLEQRNRLERKLKANISGLRPVLERERSRINRAAVDGVFDDLTQSYKDLEASPYAYIKGAYDDATHNYLDSLKEEIKGTVVKDMTVEQMEALYKAYTVVLTKIQKANTGFVNGKAIDETAEQIISEIDARKTPKSEFAAVVRNLSNKIGWSYEKLYYALERIGSETFTKLFNNLANSENIVMADVLEAAGFRDRMVEKYHYNDWKVNQKLDSEFMDNTGKTFKLTLGEMMSLYAYSRRDDAWNHFEVGGFVFKKTKLSDINPAASYKLTKEQCEGITNRLTKEQKGFVEDMQTFLSDVMGAKGNEVSMELYGIMMFGEKNYFPIHIAKDFKGAAQESQAKAEAGFSSMTNAGFTKARDKNSTAPVLLEGFMDVWADHVNEMSRYHGTVPALEDIRRVMNYSSYLSAESDSASLKATMKNKFGEDAVQYFDNLYREANSGAINDKLQKKSKWLLSKFRKGSVAYSLSVLIQQPASLSRAYALIDKRHFDGIRGIGTLPMGIAKAISNRWTKSFSNSYTEMLKYAPGVTLAKEIGGFDTASGNSIRSYLMDTGKGFFKSMKTETIGGMAKAMYDLVDDNPAANLPNAADKLAWVLIWNACKHETVEKNPNLSPRSEAFLKIAGERFTEVIRATQVYDSIFAKSPMLKSKNLAVQYLVSFMNEPNTTANMVENAVRSFAKGEWSKGTRYATAVVRGIVFTCVLKSIIYAMRDDDEDETWWDKYTGALVNNLISDATVFNYIPIARDVWSLAQGYDAERPDMAIFADLVNAISKNSKLQSMDTSDMDEEKLREYEQSVTEASWKLLESVTAFFGIPVKNVRREIDAVIDHGRIAHENCGKTTWNSLRDSIEQAIADASPVFAKPGVKSTTDKLYNAIVSGDKAYVARLKAGYKDDSAYHKAIRTGLRENDPRIKQAAVARAGKNIEEYKRIALEIIGEGHFSQDDVVLAIVAEVNAMEDGSSSTTSAKHKGIFTGDDFAAAVGQDDYNLADEIKEDIIKTGKKNGKTDEKALESFVSTATSACKEAFLVGDLSDEQAARVLMSYCDKEEYDAWGTVASWSYKQENPESEIPNQWFDTYYKKVETSGLELDVYLEYREKRAAYSLKADILKIIHSLPIGKKQKDALYFAEGWKESTLDEAPWR